MLFFAAFIFHQYVCSVPPDNGDKIQINNNNLLLRGCVIRNTDYVEGIVIYAGHETKAMLNNNGPRYCFVDVDMLSL